MAQASAPPRSRMANPFSAVPTAYRVQAGGRWWYANCAWDAFGICAVCTDRTARTRPSCPDCGEGLRRRDDERPTTRASFHCLVPAATLAGATSLHLKHDELFRSEEQIETLDRVRSGSSRATSCSSGTTRSLHRWLLVPHWQRRHAGREITHTSARPPDVRLGSPWRSPGARRHAR